jgi:large subunit ribosomal protein L18
MRKIRSEKRKRWMARRNRVRSGLARSGRVQLMVFRSSKHIYAQLVDPVDGRTIGAVSSRSKGMLEGKGGNVEAARRVGKAVADLAREKQIEEVVFNRNGFLYHGRVKALAEAARESGLRF